MTRFLYALATSAALCATAYAKPSTGNDMKFVDLGGVHTMCGLKASEADDEAALVKYAGEQDIKVIQFTDANTKKLLKAINEHPPVTAITASRMMAFRGDDFTVLAIVNAGRLCVFKPEPTKDFEAMEDNVFGAGS